MLMGGRFTDSGTYLLRRSGATSLRNVVDDSLLREVMHHKQQSETLQRHYSAAVAQLDVVTAVTMNKRETLNGISKWDAPAVFR